MQKWRECSCSQWTACGHLVIRGSRLRKLLGLCHNLFCRRLWQHVTESLRAGDIDKATEHKRALEERQRNEERLRAETETPWCTKYFLKEVSSLAVTCWGRQSCCENTGRYGCASCQKRIFGLRSYLHGIIGVRWRKQSQTCKAVPLRDFPNTSLLWFPCNKMLACCVLHFFYQALPGGTWKTA